MIDPAMQRARELAAAECATYDVARYLNGEADDAPAMIALAKHLREVSDAVEAMDHRDDCTASPDHPGTCGCRLEQARRFILAPAKPDPVDALADALYDRVLSQGDSVREALRSELELAGLELREVGK